jgi:hypothetical protein
MQSRIEDYALIGDCETAALVSKGGSVDWLSWPRFDSEACFCRRLCTDWTHRRRAAPIRAVGRLMQRRRFVSRRIRYRCPAFAWQFPAGVFTHCINTAYNIGHATKPCEQRSGHRRLGAEPVLLQAEINELNERGRETDASAQTKYT